MYILCLKVQRDFADILAPHLTSDGLVLKSLEFAKDLEHVMDFTKMRALSSLFSMLNQGARNVLNYNQQHSDFPMTVRLRNCLIIYLPPVFQPISVK